MGCCMGKLLILMLFGLLSVSVQAAKFAYVPLTTQQGNVLQVINTTTGFVVDSISMPGKSSGLLISSTSDRVYVSHRELGAISIVDTLTNGLLDTLYFVGTTPKGMAFDRLNSDWLWIATDGGLSVANPTSGEVNKYPQGGTSAITYTGLAVESFAHNGAEYVLSLGYNGADAGVSLVEAVSKNQVASFSLGTTSLGGMKLNATTGEIHLTDASNHTLKILSLTTASPPVFTSVATYPFEILNASNTKDTERTFSDVDTHVYDAVGPQDQLTFITYGMSNFVQSVCDLGSGGIKVLDSSDGSELQDLTLRAGDFSSSTSQPMLVDVRSDGMLLVLHAVVCTTDNGVFLSELQVSPPTAFDSQYRFLEVSRTSLGVQMQVVGDFVGPECALCPYGERLEPEKVKRRSAMSPWLFLLLMPLFVFRRRKSLTVRV